MAKGQDNKKLTSAQLLDIVVGQTLPQATGKLQQMGYTVTNVYSEQTSNSDGTELVISCCVAGKQVTLYMGNFILTPMGKQPNKTQK